MNKIDSDHLTKGTLSPFLPGTKIQYAFTEELRYSEWLIKNAIVNGDCWECHLAPVPKGYCYTQVGGREGIKWRVHRLIWTVINGPIPEGKIILHTCDNRKCIRHDHLVCGTEADNTEDMMSKGRGKNIPRTDHIHRERITQLHKDGLSRLEIAEKLMISASTVWNYVSPRGPYYVGE